MSNGFKRSVFWSNFQTNLAKVIDKGTNIYESLSSSFEVIERLFVLGYVIDAGAADNEAGITKNRKYFPSKREIKNYNVLINRRIFYDQPINDSIKPYHEVRKVSTGHGDDYTAGCLLDYAYVKGKLSSRQVV